MKKLLFVIDSLNSGGGEKSLVNLLNEIDYSKYSVDLQLFSSNNLFLEMVTNKVNILPLPEYFEKCKYSITLMIKKREFKWLFYRIKASLSMRLYNKNKYHIIQANWNAIRTSIKINPKQYDVAIAYSQGMPAYFVEEKIIAKEKLAWVNCLYSNTRYNKSKDHKCYENFKKIIVVSESSKEDILSVFPDFSEKIEVIYDFISRSSVENLANEKFLWKDSFKGLRIVSMLRMEWVKGPDIILYCCRLLKTAGVKFKWHIIGGGGSMEAQIRQSIKEYGLHEYSAKN